MAFTLSSPAFASGEPIPARYTCDGEGMTPPLAWSGAPEGTRSYALILEDPDAPSGMFRHWGLYNLEASLDGLPESRPNAGGAIAGIQVLHDFGQASYFPPCPPPGSGVHHYRFRLLALSTDSLEFETPPTCQGLLAMIQSHLLDEAFLSGTCERAG